jgi:hypothetical protein
MRLPAPVNDRTLGTAIGTAKGQEKPALEQKRRPMKPAVGNDCAGHFANLKVVS